MASSEPETVASDRVINSPMMEMHDLSRGHSSVSEADNVDSPCNGHEDDIFFDTIGVQFHFRTFLRQFVAHTILPLFPGTDPFTSK